MSSLTVAALFARAASRASSRPAIEDDLGTLTYDELSARVARMCAELDERHGLSSGDRALLVAYNTSRYLAAVLACALRGVVVVPVSTQLTAEEIAFVVDDARPGLVIASGDLLERARDGVRHAAAPVPLVTLEDLGSGSTASEAAQLPGPEGWPAPDDLLYLGYTSGTTGRPKGVQVTHHNRALAVLLEAVEFQLGRGDRHLVVSPLYHTAPLTFALLHLLLEGTVVVRRQFDPVRAAADLTGGVTNAFMAPSALQRILAVMDAHPVVAAELRAVIIGGSPCPSDVKAAALRQLPGRLYEFYGATEVGIVTTLRPEEQESHPASAGRLVPGAAVRIEAPGTSNAVSPGEVGEVRVRTDTQADGYWGIDTASDRARWSSLGDVGFLDEEGYLTLVDRSVDIIITGGVNVYSREVELVLEEHPAISAVAVFGIPDDRWGETVAAAVTAEEGDRPSEEDLIAYCRSHLAAFKCPKVFVWLDELPRSLTGKTNKRYLKQMYFEVGRQQQPALQERSS